MQWNALEASTGAAEPQRCTVPALHYRYLAQIQGQILDAALSVCLRSLPDLT